MDQREFHLQHLGICYKLYNFIVKALASQALKTVTLGRPSNYASSSSGVQISGATLRGSGSKANKVVLPEIPCEGNDKRLLPTQGLFGDSISPSTEHDEEKNKSFSRNIGGVLEEKMLASSPQAPKKMVSINDNLEEIILPCKMKKMSKSFKKSNSLDQEEDPKPLRSILKVGSNSNDKSNSSC